MLSRNIARTCRIVSTRRKTENVSVAYVNAPSGIAVAEIWPSNNWEESEATMPLKPNGALCQVREQIIEDAASGLTLQFECDDGRLRLVIAGKVLARGNRELLFDEEGREAAAGTLIGEFRRPNWLKSAK
jgi:hypothetical protein